MPFNSARDCTLEALGTTMPLPLPLMLPDSTLINRLCLPAVSNATPLNAPGKSAMAPKSSLPATISLVSGAPLVKFFQTTSYLASLYGPSWGRYLSSRPSSRINRPPAAPLMVVSWVPMAMRMVSAEADRVNEASTRPANAARNNMGVSPRIILGVRLRHDQGVVGNEGCFSSMRPGGGRVAVFLWCLDGRHREQARSHIETAYTETLWERACSGPRPDDER